MGSKKHDTSRINDGNVLEKGEMDARAWVCASEPSDIALWRIVRSL